jgi:hypothetical protein
MELMMEMISMGLWRIDITIHSTGLLLEMISGQCRRDS